MRKMYWANVPFLCINNFLINRLKRSTKFPNVIQFQSENNFWAFELSFVRFKSGIPPSFQLSVIHSKSIDLILLPESKKRNGEFDYALLCLLNCTKYCCIRFKYLNNILHRIGCKYCGKKSGICEWGKIFFCQFVIASASHQCKWKINDNLVCADFRAVRIFEQSKLLLFSSPHRIQWFQSPLRW